MNSSHPHVFFSFYFYPGSHPHVGQELSTSIRQQTDFSPESMPAIAPPPPITRTLEPELLVCNTMAIPPQRPGENQTTKAPSLAALPAHRQPAQGRIIGSHIFHLQEREVFSAPNFLPIQIDTGHPGDLQSVGGPYMPTSHYHTTTGGVTTTALPSTSTPWSMSAPPQSPHPPSDIHHRYPPLALPKIQGGTPEESGVHSGFGSGLLEQVSMGERVQVRYMWRDWMQTNDSNV